MTDPTYPGVAPGLRFVTALSPGADVRNQLRSARLDWQAHASLRPLSLPCAHHFDPAGVGFAEAFGQGQAEAAATAAARAAALGPEERDEHLRQVFARDPDPPVLDDEADTFSVGP